MKNLAINRPGALGDITCVIMLQDAIYRKYGHFDLYVADGYFQQLNPLLKYNKMKFTLLPGSTLITSDYKRVSNLIGYPFKDGYPKVKMTKHLILYMADELGLNLSNLPKRLQLEAPPPPTKYVNSKDYITVQLKTGWSKYKELTVEQLDSICLAVKTWFSSEIIQIGAANEPKLKNVDNYIIGHSLEEAIGAHAWARYHIGPDSLFNHLTNIDWIHKNKNTKGLIYFGSTSPTSFGYNHNINLFMGAHCQPCYIDTLNEPDKELCPFNHMCLKRIPIEFLQSYVIKLFDEK